ncbi:uncharacterized protein MEPE_06636 [Melanopsichium pennsylvanicum]|uniref:DinB-like domain-containing protein n=1 Tax=Melanopsichium pennsylvanicum TaxID=63383 RepID=A0AAJ4XSU9_9BASI|nr:uncharacterized protein MEPE_06636 [Melanopsichium pennsylvanicum]
MVSSACTVAEAEDNLLSCTAQIMNQAVTILSSPSITDKEYTFESKIISGSTPGKHFRHVLDHLRILVDAIENWQSRTCSSTWSCSELRVDYDSRIVSKLAHIETSALASLQQFERTTQRLYQTFSGSNGRLYTQRLKLCATTPFAVEMDSTVGRELWFCGLHAIHHYALARVILVKELGLEEGIDDQFGVAPSTLIHREWRKEGNRADVAHQALSQGEQGELPSSSSSSSTSTSTSTSTSSEGGSSSERRARQEGSSSNRILLGQHHQPSGHAATSRNNHQYKLKL